MRYEFWIPIRKITFKNFVRCLECDKETSVVYFNVYDISKFRCVECSDIRQGNSLNDLKDKEREEYLEKRKVYYEKFQDDLVEQERISLELFLEDKFGKRND